MGGRRLRSIHVAARILGETRRIRRSGTQHAQSDFPEVYLSDNRENRIKKINENMYKYLDENVFKEIKDSFVLVERDTPYEKGRLGLMMAVDLEEYDYTPFAPVAIRATEGTVLERIPPRVEIRRHAPLELPHIMLLIDDREHTVIEPLYENREKLELLYDTNLNMNGGHVRGWRVPDTAAVLENFTRSRRTKYKSKTTARLPTSCLPSATETTHSQPPKRTGTR